MKLAVGIISVFMVFSTWLHQSAVLHEFVGYRHTDSIIDVLFTEEKYAALLPQLEAHVATLREGERSDSLYRYVYKLGRTASFVQGAEEGISAATALLEYVLLNDTNRMHHLQAIEDLSWIYYEQGKPSEALRMDMQYREVAMGMPHLDPEIKSLASYNIGFDYMELGQWRKAVQYFQEASAVLDAHAVDDLIKHMNTNNALGAAYARMGAYENAHKALEKSRHYTMQLPDEEKRLFYLSNIDGNLSVMYEDEADIVRAKDALHQAIDARKRGLQLEKKHWQYEQQSKLLAANYHNLASLYYDIGDYARAAEVIKLERRFKEQILPKGHPEIERTLEGEANLHMALERFDSAKVCFQQYLESCLSHYGRESYFSGTAFQRMGKLHLKMGEYPESIEALTQAAEVLASVSDADTGPDVAQTYMLRSEAHMMNGHLAQAFADVQAALDIYHRALSSADERKGDCYLLKARIHKAAGDYANAIVAVDAALEQFSLKKSERRAASKLHHAGFAAQLPATHLLKATILLAADSSDATKDLALQELNRAVVLLRENKRAFQGHEAQLALYATHMGVFNLLHKLRNGRWHKRKEAKELELIFANAEESKTLLLRRQLSNFGSLRVAQVPDSLLRLERRLLAILGGIPQPGDTLASQLDVADALYDSLQRTFANQYPEYYKLRYDEALAGIGELQRDWLNNEENLLRFIHSPAGLFVILIKKSEVSYHQLDAPDLDSKINAINRAITSLENDAYLKLARELYQSLFASLQSELEGEVVFIIPDGPLFGLNFEVLVDDEDKPLLHKYSISYLHSATTALQFRRLKSEEGNGVIAIAPGFSDEVKAKYMASVNDSTLMDWSYFRRIQQPFSVATAERVSAMLSGTTYTGSEATERRFKEEASHYNIIHLGTHTEINNVSPILSRLVLSKDAGSSDDGYLHAYEIYNLPLRAELAVLTACETGVGMKSGSEGMLSLAHSFAYAGVPGIVMSLWQIDEKTSAEVVEYFYEELKKGTPRNHALRRAKLRYLEQHNGELTAPYYWSGLVLIGEVQALPQTSYTWLLWLVLGLLAAAMGWVLFRKKWEIKA